IETFPVGARVAFDALRGRLWAVCARCGRWNLAPIEERWEAVEDAERLFVDASARVHSENIGLARLRDGTRLIRVGEAVPGEIAAWRYGTQLVSRRNRNIAVTGALAAGGVAFVAGLPLIAGISLPIGLFNVVQFGTVLRGEALKRRVVHRIPADSADGADVIVRRWHLHHAVLSRSDNGELAVDLPPLVMQSEWNRRRHARDISRDPEEPLRITGDAARRVVTRSMLDFNRRGATKSDVERALVAIGSAGGAEAFARNTAEAGSSIVRIDRFRGAVKRQPAYSLRQVLGTFRGEVLPVVKYRDAFDFLDPSRPRLSKVDALALEMSLQDEAERHALEGELASLEAAWREAEEIAHIADSLPGEPGS
ncbi:MAG: hypothetical protein KFH98_06080, partial [Gemmatimonadetes bacterium]|nr:hypothetical protein [Gemmatimonadota bacterium]